MRKLLIVTICFLSSTVVAAEPDVHPNEWKGQQSAEQHVRCNTAWIRAGKPNGYQQYMGKCFETAKLAVSPE
jgi:hypothetical protein